MYGCWWCKTVLDVLKRRCFRLKRVYCKVADEVDVVEFKIQPQYRANLPTRLIHGFCNKKHTSVKWHTNRSSIAQALAAWTNHSQKRRKSSLSIGYGPIRTPAFYESRPGSWVYEYPVRCWLPVSMPPPQALLFSPLISFPSRPSIRPLDHPDQLELHGRGHEKQQNSFYLPRSTSEWPHRRKGWDAPKEFVQHPIENSADSYGWIIQLTAALVISTIASFRSESS
jgi:hypothetical protein